MFNISLFCNSILDFQEDTKWFQLVMKTTYKQIDLNKYKNRNLLRYISLLCFSVTRCYFICIYLFLWVWFCVFSYFVLIYFNIVFFSLLYLNYCALSCWMTVNCLPWRIMLNLLHGFFWKELWLEEKKQAGQGGQPLCTGAVEMGEQRR